MHSYRKKIGIGIFIIAWVTLIFGGRFTGNGFAMFGFFLLGLSLVVYYWDGLRKWLKYGDAPKDSGKMIEIEPWIEKPEAPTSIIIQFPKLSDSKEDDKSDN